MNTIFTRINWIDIAVLIVLFRICYISLFTGLAVEFFKFLGTIFALYFSFHYYTVLADKIVGLFPFINDESSRQFFDFIIFFLLILAIYLIFVAIRKSVDQYLKMEAEPNLNRWGGFFFGVIRSFLVVGIVSYMLVISSVAYLKDSVGHSLSGANVVKIGPSTYSFIWDSVISKFAVSEEKNAIVDETLDTLEKEK